MNINQELEQLEAEGKTCKDCSHYSACHLKRNKHLELPLCFKFDLPPNDEWKIKRVASL